MAAPAASYQEMTAVRVTAPPPASAPPPPTEQTAMGGEGGAPPPAGYESGGRSGESPVDPLHPHPDIEDTPKRWWRRRRWATRRVARRFPSVLRQPCVVAGGFVLLFFVTVFALLHTRDFIVDPYQAAISFVVWLLIGLVVVATAQTIYITFRFVCR